LRCFLIEKLKSLKLEEFFSFNVKESVDALKPVLVGKFDVMRTIGTGAKGT